MYIYIYMYLSADMEAGESGRLGCHSSAFIVCYGRLPLLDKATKRLLCVHKNKPKKHETLKAALAGRSMEICPSAPATVPFL